MANEHSLRKKGGLPRPQLIDMRMCSIGQGPGGGKGAGGITLLEAHRCIKPRGRWEAGGGGGLSSKQGRGGGYLADSMPSNPVRCRSAEAVL